jgi:hypothetical protein
MLYAIFCYDSEAVTNAWSKAYDDQVMTQLGGVLSKLADQKRLGPTARLMPTTTATTVRKGNEAMIIDGPFAETKEQLLGFYIVECASLDEALETAKDLAKASGSAGAFEIRPVKFFEPGVSLS